MWEGSTPEDIAAAFKNATLDLGLQLPILKGTDAWFGTAPVNRVLVGGERRTVRHLKVTWPERQKYTAGNHFENGFNPMTVTLAYLKRIKVDTGIVVKIEGDSVEGFTLLLNIQMGAAATLRFAEDLQQLPHVLS